MLHCPDLRNSIREQCNGSANQPRVRWLWWTFRRFMAAWRYRRQVAVDRVGDSPIEKAAPAHRDGHALAGTVGPNGPMKVNNWALMGFLEQPGSFSALPLPTFSSPHPSLPSSRFALSAPGATVEEPLQASSRSIISLGFKVVTP